MQIMVQRLLHIQYCNSFELFTMLFGRAKTLTLSGKVQSSWNGEKYVHWEHWYLENWNPDFEVSNLMVKIRLRICAKTTNLSELFLDYFHVFRIWAHFSVFQIKKKKIILKLKNIKTLISSQPCIIKLR